MLDGWCWTSPVLSLQHTSIHKQACAQWMTTENTGAPQHASDANNGVLLLPHHHSHNAWQIHIMATAGLREPYRREADTGPNNENPKMTNSFDGHSHQYQIVVNH